MQDEPWGGLEAAVRLTDRLTPTDCSTETVKHPIIKTVHITELQMCGEPGKTRMNLQLNLEGS